MKSTLLKKTVVTPISFWKSLARFWRRFHPTKHIESRSKYSPCHAAIAVSFSNYSRHRRPPAIGILMEKGGRGVRARANASIISFQFVAGARQVGGGMPPIPRRRPVIEEPPSPTRISVLDIEFRSIEWVVEPAACRQLRAHTEGGITTVFVSKVHFSCLSPLLFSENQNSEQRNRVRKLKIISKWAGNLFQNAITNHVKQK